ncbi:hypothetical protein DSC45_01165 [Streptomyces sp. YIM 130001]|uniref:hypothetical protein n=1 Tax=Streptomyces sp. YIM 130001 TaxID=2259644 RepID=UPI000E659153|nr:hypothetical protein [Streptomyces sp. YIM 130001]RII20999.1 hypothetical protein DSC45_01165 [Streptomyces sp. YIM 130001]
MPASERDPHNRPKPPSMSELLASCAAAKAVSTPPAAPERHHASAPARTNTSPEAAGEQEQLDAA